MDDLLLVEAIKRDDTHAFKVLFERHYRPLVGYITTYTDDLQLSEDIVQQTFITIWEQRSKYVISTSVKSYLYSASYNAFVDHYRKIKRHDSFFEDLKERALRDAIIEDKELLEKRIQKLKRIIETLPPRCKEILDLNKMGGLKYSEISEKLDVSVKTVESQMRIAYQKIREGFEDDTLFLMLIYGFKVN